MDRLTFAKSRNPTPGRRGLDVAPRPSPLAPAYLEFAGVRNLNVRQRYIVLIAASRLSEHATCSIFTASELLARQNHRHGTQNNSGMAIGTGCGSIHGGTEDSRARKKVIVFTQNGRLFVGVIQPNPSMVLILTYSLNQYNCIPP